MNSLIVRTIFFKELLETLRDKRTMLTMIGLPIVLYPTLFFVSIQMMLIQENKMEETISKVAVSGPISSSVRTTLDDSKEFELQFDLESPEESLKLGEIDAILQFSDDFSAQLSEMGSGEITIFFDRTEAVSREAEERLFSALNDINKTIMATRITSHNLPEGFALPLKVGNENIATASKSSGTILGAILPMILVMMLGLGAFYPAVDLTAGEKERGTFETLLSTPATKLDIVVGKFLAVFTLSMVTGFLNLFSMAVTIYFQLSQLINHSGGMADGEQLISISLLSMVGMAVVIIPLAFFISAIMMSVAVLARSFKEAQHYLSPLFILIVLPVSVASFPGIELTATTQFIPLTNIALLFRELIVGDVQIDQYFIVFMCTCVYALFSLVIATWMFQREEVILSEDKGLPLTFDRRAFTPSHIPTAGTAMGIFAVVMLLIFYAGTYVQGNYGLTGLVITQYALILLPVIVILRYIKVDLRSALNLKGCSPLSVLAVVICSLSWVVINLQFSQWHEVVLPLPDIIKEAMKGLLGENGTSVYLLIFIVAVSPAICEEVLFRGAITSGLRNLFTPRTTILIVALLFGLFHMSIYRFALTGMTGIVLTYFVIRSGSIYLSITAHFINNAVAILLGKEALPQSAIDFLNDHNVEEEGIPIMWFFVAVVVFIAGIILFEKSLPKKAIPEEPS